MDRFCRGEIDHTRCVADLFNAIGVCVVAGNIRRSAEIAIGSPDDETFLHLKDYDRHPDRREIGWVSNNSVAMRGLDDLEKLDEIAGLIRNNGEPGLLNLENIQRYGRFGEAVPDRAWLTNPCGEIALESYELCNLAEILPTRCPDRKAFDEAVEFATFYAVTVSLLPTHRAESNAVIERNRRTGVSVSGIADWIEKEGLPRVVRTLRKTYRRVRDINERLAHAAGIPVSLKVTTVKPSGTTSLLAGVSPGMHYPPARFALRRLRIGNTQPIAAFLKEAGVPHAPDATGENTTVFEFPIRYDNPRSAREVSAWEQLALLSTLQREWSDNMVSCTVTFDEAKEGPRLARMLAYFLPVVKSVSMMPLEPEEAYAQMPVEEIGEEEYEKKAAAMPVIDWRLFRGGDGTGEGYCSKLTCGL
jgi:ribonucleoside-diphosphate reductase alpha chain